MALRCPRCNCCAGMSRQGKILLGVGLGILLFIGIILFATSFDVIEPFEAGLNYNTITKNVDQSRIYTPGRYLIGVSNKFLVFSLAQRTIEFSTEPGATAPPLNTRTADGLALTLQVSFQYSLKQQYIPQLYTTYNIKYEETFIREARDQILEVAGMFVAPSYWKERALIGDTIQRFLHRALASMFANVHAIQILQVDLPLTYEESIVQTEVRQQEIVKAQYEQQAAQIKAQASAQVAAIEASVVTLNAGATADASLWQRTSEAWAHQRLINSGSVMYADAMQDIGITAKQLPRYVLFQALTQRHTKASVLYALPGTALVDVRQN